MRTLAGDLARALGNVDAMQQLYADDICWTLPLTLGPYSKSSMKVAIHHEFGAGDFSAARFTTRSTVKATDEAYENALLVRGRDGKISEVHEYLDTLTVMHYEGLRRFLPQIPGVVVS